jgi:hypothetical protein
MALCLQLARITRKPSRAGNPAGGALYFELHMAGGNLNRKFEPQIKTWRSILRSHIVISSSTM